MAKKICLLSEPDRSFPDLLNADLITKVAGDSLNVKIYTHCRSHIAVFPKSHETRTQLDELPLLGAIPRDPATADSDDSGRPIIVSAPESPISHSFHDIGQRVTDILAEGHQDSTLREQSGPGAD